MAQEADSGAESNQLENHNEFPNDFAWRFIVRQIYLVHPRVLCQGRARSWPQSRDNVQHAGRKADFGGDRSELQTGAAESR